MLRRDYRPWCQLQRDQSHQSRPCMEARADVIAKRKGCVMAWTGKMQVESLEVEGAELKVVLKARVDEGLAKEAAVIHHANQEPIVTLVSEHMVYDLPDVKLEEIGGRSRQTSWAQALKERLTGHGPKTG